ncbi:MAG: DUF2238 domain-containing protein [Erysipelotrichaceae bacterium]|jgi:hypothetical protein|nr:DUF2238 domain-containing protein [Erysipelotrichaceae bacterium]
MRNDKTLKMIWYACGLVYVITLLFSFWHNWQIQDKEALGMAVVACITPLIVPIIFHIFHFQPVYEIYILSTLFMYFASLIGSTFHWYSYPGFDKALHFSSGIFATIVAVIVFYLIRKSNRLKTEEDRRMMLVFINAFNLAIAVCWEFYEYALLIFFNNDAINHYTQGVHDTITDMMCACVGGILMTLCIWRARKTGKENFFTNIYQKFYEKNIRKEDADDR